MIDVYELRQVGREYCQTEGSEHYKSRTIEPIDYLYANNLLEDFAIGNIIKYATRFKHTRNPADLKKVSDYAHILCGTELIKKAEQ